MKEISVVFGTRPEAIKLCPLVLALKEHPKFSVDVCVTGQHREMLDQVLEVFGVTPDIDFDLIERNQSLVGFTCRCMASVDGYFADRYPDMVLVQGDTATVLSTSLAAFYKKIPIGHVEAGLRTGNKYSPFPEEINRVLTSHIADLHFAPTETAKQNLIRESVPEERIFVTGNTVIDALLFAREEIRENPPEVYGVPEGLFLDTKRPLVLITGHRRENFGEGFESICRAIGRLSDEHPEVSFVYPVHLNPNVQKPVRKHLEGKKNVFLTPPLDYLPFVAFMDRARLILTDSGGVQEEAPSLGKPVLVMRDTTERPEAVETGTVKLVGTDENAIVENVTELLNNKDAYRKMGNATNPYGDGKACDRIVAALEAFFSEEGPEEGHSRGTCSNR